MGILSKMLGQDLEGPKLKKFEELEKTFAGDKKMLAFSKSTYMVDRGSHLLEAGDLKKAEPDFIEAIQLWPNNLLARSSLAAVYLHSSRAKEGIKVLKASPKSALTDKLASPAKPRYYKQLGACYLEIGELGTARKHFETFLDLLQEEEHMGTDMVDPNEVLEVDQLVDNMSRAAGLSEDKLIKAKVKRYVQGLGAANKVSLQTVTEANPKLDMRERLGRALVGRNGWAKKKPHVFGYQSGGTIEIKKSDKLADMVVKVVEVELEEMLSELEPKERKVYITGAKSKLRKQLNK